METETNIYKGELIPRRKLLKGALAGLGLLVNGCRKRSIYQTTFEIGLNQGSAGPAMLGTSHETIVILSQESRDCSDTFPTPMSINYAGNDPPIGTVLNCKKIDEKITPQ